MLSRHLFMPGLGGNKKIAFSMSFKKQPYANASTCKMGEREKEKKKKRHTHSHSMHHSRIDSVVHVHVHVRKSH